jgi:hypothetical protein
MIYFLISRRQHLEEKNKAKNMLVYALGWPCMPVQACVDDPFILKKNKQITRQACVCGPSSQARLVFGVLWIGLKILPYFLFGRH